MAAVPDSRFGAGGKIVTNRRRMRLASTPYDRPPPPLPPKSPNWFTGVIIPSARALASGAGKLISSAIYSDSESSSSEDVDSASDDDVGNEYTSPCDGVNALNELESHHQKNGYFLYHVLKYGGEKQFGKEILLQNLPPEEKMTSPEMIVYGRESQFSMQKPETKRLIEQLIMQEDFSREECDRLINVLNSRVKDWSAGAGDKRSLVNSPGQRVDHEDPNILNKAVLEAKKWFQEKKGELSSVAELAHGTRNHNCATIDHMESEVGSPVDMARSYMRERPPWASPTERDELRTPLTTTMKLFKERTPYSVTDDILSSSKRRSSPASWDIREELRKVRSKAIEDMLRTSPAKNDSSLFAVAEIREEFVRAGKTVSGMGEEITKPLSFWRTTPIDALMDVGVNANSALVALESRPDGKASEAPTLNPDASASGNNEDPETIQSDGVHALSKFPTSPNHTEQQHPEGPTGTGVVEFGGRLHTNGSLPAQASLSPAADITLSSKQYDEETHNDTASNENRPTNGTNVDGNCELLSEVMEVPIVTETNSINSGSQISLGMQNEESQLGTTQPSAEVKPDLTTGTKHGRKLGKTNRRTRGKGK